MMTLMEMGISIKLYSIRQRAARHGGAIEDKGVDGVAFERVEHLLFAPFRIPRLAHHVQQRAPAGLCGERALAAQGVDCVSGCVGFVYEDTVLKPVHCGTDSGVLVPNGGQEGVRHFAWPAHDVR